MPESLESIIACVQQSDPISSWSAAEPQKPNWAGIWEESTMGWNFFWRDIPNSYNLFTRNFDRSPRFFVPYNLFQYLFTWIYDLFQYKVISFFEQSSVKGTGRVLTSQVVGVWGQSYVLKQNALKNRQHCFYTQCLN